ncbi:DUF4059 family protein [Streptococcus merionis]|uniref:Amino acid transporter, AAT family n=1 Tax=Streptococcus merionis TaxID=400065 RepID=A0A239SUU3_9STRE|nr:DUF4059 family protein [Streptococcus merionis]SNU89285.1 amino acid transporter, AAT family [Streptococcus merionis]
MLARILSLYLQSLAGTTFLTFVIGSFCLFWRKFRKKDKTDKERRSSTYEVLLISVMVIPILSFALMGIILMIRV